MDIFQTVHFLNTDNCLHYQFLFLQLIVAKRIDHTRIIVYSVIQIPRKYKLVSGMCCVIARNNADVYVPLIMPHNYAHYLVFTEI